MTATLHVDLARAAIEAVLSGVTDIGQVHDYERYAADWETFISYFVAENIGDANEQMLRGWTISVRDIADPEQVTFGPPGGAGISEVTYYFVIRGYNAVIDQPAEGETAAKVSEKDWVTLCAAVKAALDADTSLHSGVYDDGANGNFVSELAAMRWDYRMFSDVLCHYAEIGLPVTEVV